jgi:membrane glycosyltransferase
MSNSAAQTVSPPTRPETVTITTRIARPGLRLFLFYSVAVLLTGAVSMLFADLLWRTGWSPSRTVLLTLFIILFFLMAIGCVQGVFGFFLKVFGDRNRITALGDWRNKSITGTSTALVFPVYNENVTEVCERLRSMYESLEAAGQIKCFDFFILSDSTDPDKWLEEERQWFTLVKELNALGRIYYRRRVLNEEKKSGNIREFLSTWGRRYRYFIVMDADSVMSGETITNLVKLMETHTDVGLIQTAPSPINATSLYGRIQQFGSRLYGPIFTAGLNYWSQGIGNYWGHNAIIRTEPFIQFCDLPNLPGRKPFGGQILSHDFVEAALMLRANWQVWFAYDLDGSYEEIPQGLIENAERDRRWCQGNLQHGMLLFARGLRGISRIHLILGIFGYLGGPLWLFFLLTFHGMRWSHKSTGLSDITVGNFTPYLQVTATQHAFLVFSLCMFVLFLPKILALLDLALDKTRRRAFGGWFRATTSAILETVFSTLHAPLQMLWHTAFVFTLLRGRTVNWGSQKRSADGTTWGLAFKRHWGHTLIGLVWGALVWHWDRTTFWWFAPVLAGMVSSIPLSVLTNRRGLGLAAQKLRLFATPEETSPSKELQLLRERMEKHAPADEESRGKDSGLADAVLDPYANAIHISLQLEKRLTPGHTTAISKLSAGQENPRALGERLLRVGPDALTQREKLVLLADADAMSWLHKRIWLEPSESLAPWWQKAIKQYV